MRATQAFRHQRFRLAWFGQLVNVTGDALFGVALTLFLLPRGDAATAIGLVLGAMSVGGIVSLLIGGALADRHRRTRIVVLSDLVRVAGLLGLLAVGREGGLPSLGLFAAITGVGGGLYRPAYGALFPALVPPEAIPSANAARSLTNRFATIVGAALAGVLVAATNPVVVMWLDAATFLVSVATMLAIREAPLPVRSAGSAWQDVVDGLRFVRRRSWLSAVMLQGTAQVAFVISPVQVALPIVVGTESEAWLGYVVAAEAFGALVGATLAASLRPERPGRLSVLALLLQLPQLLALGWMSSVAIVAAASVLAGFALSVFGVLWVSALQTRVVNEQLGRVMSLDALAATGLAPVGLGVAGWAIGAFGTPGVMAFAGAVLVISVVAVLPVPGVLDFAPPTSQQLRESSSVHSP